MRAMQINAKKKEYVNAPIGPFTMFSHCECDYNIRNELVSATKNAEDTEYQYQYDDIGNRISSFDLGTNRTYAANNLNQYTLISNLCDSASLRETFIPQFDDDGNQTLIQTATGIWQAQYNGENRPIFWSNGVTNIVMQFDRMGRRVEYIETCGSSTNANNTFTYDNYLLVARHRDNLNGTFSNDRFIWDPTEPIATRPLVFDFSNVPPQYYTHDGNKNVSDLIDLHLNITVHYDHTPFGALNFISTSSASYSCNPFRFSSEYADDVLSLICYNYRHNNCLFARWLSRDIAFSVNLYAFVSNSTMVDWLGLESVAKVCIYSAVGRYENQSLDVPMPIDNGISRHTWLSVESADTDEASWVYHSDNTYSFGPYKDIKKRKDFERGVPGGFFDPSYYRTNSHSRVVKKCWSADYRQTCCVKSMLGKYPAIFSKRNYCTTEVLRVMLECGFKNVPDGVGKVVKGDNIGLGEFPNPLHLALQLEIDGGIDLRLAQRFRDIGVMR